MLHAKKLMNEYLVFDFETSGLDPNNDRIIQVGFCRVVDSKPIEQGGWLVNQTVRIHPEAYNLHGLSLADLQHRGIPPGESYEKLLALMNGAPGCVGHNIHQFDIRFLLAEGRRLQLEVPETHAFVDTAAHYKGRKMGAHKHSGECERDYANRVLSARVKGLSYSIPTCIRELQLDVTSSTLHNASHDAYATHLIFEALRPF